MILYSAKSTIDGDGTLAHRVTKFADGEVESSYLTTPATCNCPAGVRPTCRHRQMLPDMIATDIVNTQWFYDFDQHLVVDFDGTPKYILDRVLEPAGEALQGDLPRLSGLQEETILMGFHQPELCTPTPAPASPKPWRRL